MNHPAVSYPRDESTPVSHLPFSPAVQVGDLIFISGQASVDAKGTIVPDTFEGEVRRSIENLRAVLESAGSDLAHVVQTRNYVRDPANVAEFNKLYREYFSAPHPARTTITNCLPETLHFEIDCVAVPAGSSEHSAD
ncbi:RidA family protein [Actomonas aquatica]|uniref:RidA family protein n=1 Tax=Actomonas aquatica TaxID=2866162 RepID=A0ABZ1CEH0_9BACT|nr:RidA family protein [Opitutus sp. WL0086]WRQ90086.1 RidA family protein [Opitutus sp. WL0086]